MISEELLVLKQQIMQMKAAVRDFLKKNPDLGYVAVKEAKRYL